MRIIALALAKWRAMGFGEWMTDQPFTRVMTLDSLPDGELRPACVDGTAILLCHNGGEIFAIARYCSHAEQSLEFGAMRHGWIACPAHGARFDLVSGEPINPPATRPIATYPVRIVDGMIEVAV